MKIIVYSNDAKIIAKIKDAGDGKKLAFRNPTLWRGEIEDCTHVYADDEAIVAAYKKHGAALFEIGKPSKQPTDEAVAAKKKEAK